MAVLGHLLSKHIGEYSMNLRDEDIDIERAAHDPDYRRKVIARLNREPVKPAVSADTPEMASETTVD